MNGQEEEDFGVQTEVEAVLLKCDKSDICVGGNVRFGSE